MRQWNGVGSASKENPDQHFVRSSDVIVKLPRRGLDAPHVDPKRIQNWLTVIKSSSL